ncbi:MAG: preprotein translocase subunit SecF [Chloroflexota bacterium]|nr:preprotein translocase subunit SecF [Chloroflexota bacterium]
MYDIVGKRNLWFAISALLTIPGLIFIFLGGLRPSIDFTGGTEWEVRYAEEPTAAEMTAALTELGHDDALVTQLPDGFLRIRTRPIDLIPLQTPAPSPSASGSVSASPSTSAGASASASASVEPSESVSASAAPSPSASAPVSAEPSASSTESAAASPSASVSPSAEPSAAPIAEGTEFASLESDLEDRFGAGEPRLLRTVGPIIGADLIRSSAILIVIGELFILAYLWMRFGFRFGTAAIVALLHDVILVVGTFAILGFFFGLEFDALFVTALLTIIGFSVHDTIVVFDRIRENRIRHAGESFGHIVNHSLLQTVARSIITSLTVVVTLGALLLLGPPTIRTFTLALLLGVVSGTYSSIFNASQILVAWNEWDARRKTRESPARPARSTSR